MSEAFRRSDPDNLRDLADWLRSLQTDGLTHHAPDDLDRIADAIEEFPLIPEGFPDWRVV